ncbi:hypothetical protein HRF87_03920 [Bacillus sp. CRN 9]|nr:hypothetical protein [Bacillus sp. CRN 9]
MRKSKNGYALMTASLIGGPSLLWFSYSRKTNESPVMLSGKAGETMSLFVVCPEEPLPLSRFSYRFS